MGFYGPEPFDSAQATYVWTGLGEPGFFSVEVMGHAPNFTSGITLVRDTHFVGGLKINVMGWTGPWAGHHRVQSAREICRFLPEGNRHIGLQQDRGHSGQGNSIHDRRGLHQGCQRGVTALE